MHTHTNAGRWGGPVALVGALALVASLGGCDDGEGADALPDDGLPNAPVCAYDDNLGPESAATLGADAVQGALCPVEDADWYAVTVPPGAGLLSVSLAMDTPLSPVEPTYALRRRTGDLPVVASPGAVGVGEPLALTHCVAPGDYWLVVRDQNDDAQDRRNRYTLQISTAPDPDPTEPDGSPEAARPLAAGEAVEARLACRSDEDWYAITVGDQPLVRVTLTMPVARLQPRVRLVTPDGQTLLDETNLGGARVETVITRALAVRTPGPLFVVVSDDDGVDSDPEVAYRLQVDLGDELDVNEPNDRAAEASDLMGLTCGEAWSEWRAVEGSLAVPGDPDWFRLPLMGCERGVIEAEWTLDEAGLDDAGRRALQAQLQGSLALVVGHGPSRCMADADCRLLNLPCRSGWDCAGLGNTCAAEGRCAGAAACLKEALCGGFRVERRHSPAASPEAPVPEHRVRLSAPLDGQRLAYLRVADVGADGADPQRLYSLRVRVRRDPDEHEPSNLYAPTLLQSDPTDVQVDHAIAHNWVPVHACGGGEGREKGVLDQGVDQAVPDLAVVDMAVVDQAVVDMAVRDQAVPDLAVPDLAVPDLGPRDMAVPDLAVPDQAVPDAGPRDQGAPDADLLDAGPLDASPADASTPDMGFMGVPGLVDGCCGPDDWIEGAISYEADQDWYAYAHPCPGEDCMVRIRYEVEGGPVDPFWQIYRGDSLWFDTVLAVAEAPDQAPRQGSFGGTAPGDQCFYAFQGHRGGRDTPYFYSLRVRDLLPVKDWAPGQRYRFCIEKVADQCVSPPCVISPNGECDTP